MADPVKQSQKALRDKLQHLKSGRDNHTPVQDKTKIKEPTMPKMPNMKTPRVQAMAKSDERDAAVGDLFKAFDDWQAREEKFKNKILAKSKEEPLMKPFKSDAQRRAMYAAAEGESNIGIPEKVGKEFISDSKGQDQSKLPEKIAKSEGMCKSEDLKSMLHCLCDECRHDSGVMEKLKMRCMCDGCCAGDDFGMEKSEPHPVNCRCDECREAMEKSEHPEGCKCRSCLEESKKKSQLD